MSKFDFSGATINAESLTVGINTGIIAVLGPCSHISDQRRIQRITRESDLYGRKFDGFIITDKYTLTKSDNQLLDFLKYRQPELFEK